MRMAFLILTLFLFGCKIKEPNEPKNFDISIYENLDSISVTIFYRLDSEIDHTRVLTNYEEVVKYKKELQFLAEKIESVENKFNDLSNTKVSQETSLQEGQ